MKWLLEMNKWIAGLTISSIIIGVVVLVAILLLFIKPEKNRKNIKYIYAFGSGFVLITAIVGQFVEAREQLKEKFENDGGIGVAEIFIIIAVVFGGILFGSLIAVGITKLHKKYSSKKQTGIHDHSHGVDNEYELLTHKHSKMPGILLLLSHRLPAGIAIGGLLSSAIDKNSQGHVGLEIMAVVAFIIHIIPELIIIFYGLIDSGKSKTKSFLFGLLAKFLILPGVFIGLAIGNLAEQAYWLQPLMFVIIGTIISWGVILELMPEFIHYRKQGSTITSMSLVMMSGIALSLTIQFIHTH